MRFETLGIAFSFATTLSACDDASAPNKTGDLSGTYAYLARQGDIDVVAGTVRLVVGDDSSVTGTWALQRVPGSDTSIAVGPQLGTGALQGRRTATGLWLDLNPGWADNNVFLSLSARTADALAGMWDHSTLLGPVAGGPVRLRRVQR